MANRKLLEENTVSKFMKLAKIDSSRSKRFLTEMYGYDEKKDVPGEEEEGLYGMDEMGSTYEQEEGGLADKPVTSLDELEMPDGELEDYLDEAEKKSEDDDEMGELSMTSEEAKDIVSALEKLLDKLKAAVESGPEEEETPEGPEETEPSSGEGEGEAPEAGAEAGAATGTAEAPGGAEELKEALVNRVARRVAARLLRESKKRSKR